MRNDNSKSMSIVELRKLHKAVTNEFSQRLWLEEIKIDQRLRHLRGANNISDLDRSRVVPVSDVFTLAVTKH